MLTVIAVIAVYYIGNVILNYVFSINLCGFVSLLSSNFECGFVSALSTHIRFKLNYWLVVINFLIFELELLLTFLYIFLVVSYFIIILFFLLLLLLFFDLYYDK